MFKLYDSFRSFDNNLQPYSFSVERHTETANLHAGVCDDGFHLKSIGNRHIVNTPTFRTGRFATEFRFNYMEEFDPRFTVYFQYDKFTRAGLGIRVHYRLSGSLLLSLVSVSRTQVQVLDTQKFEGISISDMEWVSLSLVKTPTQVLCIIKGCEAVFSYQCQSGVIAIERENFIGELILKFVSFETEENYNESIVLPEITVDIPCFNGGDIPYKVSWLVTRFQEQLYLRCKLDGGTKTRPLNREDRMGQYVAEKDFMTDPYVGIRSGGEEMLFNLLMGEHAFIDPNIYWDCQKGFFGDTEIPVETTFLLPQKELSDDAELIFGYKVLKCSGYGGQEGGCEFRFNRSGDLCYYGNALNGQDQWEVLSPHDKFALSLIPENCYNRNEIEHHLKFNHYFEISEKIRFTLEYRTCIDPDYLTVEASLIDVFETQVLDTAVPKISAKPWHKAYSCLEAVTEFGQLGIGVYKIMFLVYYGGKPYQRITHVFEVFAKDNDLNPALATGLPFTFSMPNEQKWLMRNSFDLWSPAHSCDVEHYITCITDTPIEAETRKVWEVIKPFKREWYAWLARRTCNNYLSESHKEVRDNSDYLFFGMEPGFEDWLGNGSIFPFNGGNYWEYNRINTPLHRECLTDFLAIHPNVAESIGFEGNDEPVSEDVFIRLMKLYGSEWMKFTSERIMQVFRSQNAELAEENPSVRRSLYGPIGCYSSPTLTYWSASFYGHPFDHRLSEEVYTGFAIFEDYPYSCSYQTYRGAFAAMTIMLHSPKLRLYPEQYGGGRGGCIDGAVKFAHAPMGAFKLDAYQNSTHAFEYVFNTPYRLADGYHYWDQYGFHRSNCNSAFMDQLVKDWKYVIKHKAKKPMRSLAFVADYDTCDDYFDYYPMEKDDQYIWSNRSESGSGLIHDCSREAGLPNGFAMKFDTLQYVNADECDILILPSLKNVSSEIKEEIRRLYDEGVNLIGLSHIDGLEDIFGVKTVPKHEQVCTFSFGKEIESVLPMEATFFYEANDATVVALANSCLPAVITTNRTMLINTDVKNLGCCDLRKVTDNCGNHISGQLLRKCLQEQILKLAKPLVHGENVGVTLFETQAGKTVLMAIDYTPFDNQTVTEKEAVIKVMMPNVSKVIGDREVFVGRKNGVVKELRFSIRPHETVFFELDSK